MVTMNISTVQGRGALRFRSSGCYVFAVLFGILCCGSGYAQSTFGSVRGTAQDSSGAALPEVQVTLHSVDENIDRVVKTDSNGGFTIENVKPGPYSVRADLDGFTETVVNGINLE